MKKSTGIRMLLRSPVKTVLTLILIAAAVFLFLYSLLDYTMTKREYDRNYGLYHGYFNLLHREDQLIEEQWMMAARNMFFLSDPASDPAYTGWYAYEDYHLRSLPEEEIASVTSLPYVSGVQERYMTGGLAEFPRLYTYNNMINYSFFLHTHRVVFEGTYAGTTPDIHKMNIPLILGDALSMGVKLKDVKVLAGSEEDLKQSRNYIDKKLLYLAVNALIPEKADGSLHERFDNPIVTAYTGNWITTDDILGLEPGKRYVFVASVDIYASSNGIIDEDHETDPLFYFARLGDDSLYGTCAYITPLEGEPENYLETEKFAGLRRLMEIIDTDQYTLDVHYLEDMATLKRYQEGQLQITRGRQLTREDSANHDPVCVIAESLAKAYKLDVGDTLHLELGDRLLEQYMPFGAVAYSPLRYAENWTGQDFTIVGTFMEGSLKRLSNENQFWAYGENAVMVPLSFLPETADKSAHEFKPTDVTFVIEDADSIIPFRDEVLPRLQEAGYIVHFSDGGWPAVSEQLSQAGSLTLVKLCAFALSSGLVLWLTVYLYILRKKKEYAIMRALGCPVGRARGALLFPLFALALPAAVLGSAAAVIYTRFAAEQNAAEFALFGITTDISIPGAAVLAGFGGSMAFLLLLAWAALIRVAAKPPLELLQGSGRRKRGRRQKALPPEPEDVPVFTALPVLPEPVYRSHTAPAHTLRYVGRHLRRTLLKSLLSMLLALVLSFSIGFFTLLRSTYRDLYQNIEVHPRFLNGISDNRAAEIAKSGYVRDPYYEYTRRDCESNLVPDTLVMTNQISRVTDAEIVWREGKGPEMFSQSSAFCVISRDLAETLGYDLGSRLEICSSGYLYLLINNYPLLSYDEVVEQVYHKCTHKFTVAGIAEEEGMKVYAPVATREHFGSMFADYIPLDLAEFTLNDYHKATEFRSYVFRVLTGRPGSFSMETGEADRIYQTYRLLELLYPIAFALALVLGGVLPAVIILQSAMEAALLRVLGTTKRRTRTMLSLEQMILCVLGLLFAAAGLIGLKGDALRPVSGLLGLYAGSHFALCIMGTLLAAASVTRRHVLELLQTKE